MFGALLRIGQQLGRQLAILRRGGAPPARAGDGADGDAVVAQAHENLRARADDAETSEIEEEQERRRVQAAQRPIE